MRRLLMLSGVILLCVVGLWVAPAAQAQTQQCFPETGFCLSGRFLSYWQQQGGLPVFGYPLSAEQQQDGRTVQYLERQRFEWHPENQAPYDVLLGRLGAESLARDGIDWANQTASPVAACQWFPETGHNVCDQQANRGFLSYWQGHGLEFDGQSGVSYAESLALFGLPLTEAYPSVANGQLIQVQWFERARFEWYPENDSAYQVLLGRLGAEIETLPAPPAQSYDSQTSVVDLLASYYNAVNRQEYERAYNYWQSNPSDFASFTAGYANTAAVQLLIEPPTFIDGAAGTLRSAIPTALVATQKDGTQQYFTGCYVVRTPSQPPTHWQIEQAVIAQVGTRSELFDQIDQQCAAFGVPTPADASQLLDSRDTPISLLTSFYNAINRQEYQRAYGYWESPAEDFSQFVAGYAGTTRVVLLVQPPVWVDVGAGNAYGAIPTALIATKSDGSQQVFAGCYVTHRVNIEPDSQWGIARGAIAAIPSVSAIPSSVAGSCGG